MKVSAPGSQSSLHSSPAVEVEVVPVRHNVNLDAMGLLLSEKLQRMLGSFSSGSGIFASSEWHLQRSVVHQLELETM